MDQTCGGGAGRLWIGMPRVIGLGGGTRNTAPQVSRTPQPGGIGEVVGRGEAVGGRPELQKDVQDA